MPTGSLGRTDGAILICHPKFLRGGHKNRTGGKRGERKTNSERKVRNGRKRKKKRQYNLIMRELEMQDKVKPKLMDLDF